MQAIATGTVRACCAIVGVGVGVVVVVVVGWGGVGGCAVLCYAMLLSVCAVVCSAVQCCAVL
jgi:hypothetical protein